MPMETPRYAIRAQVDEDTSHEVLVAYMARAAADMMNASLQERITIIDGRPRPEWMKNWGAIYERYGTTEPVIRKIISKYDHEELQRIFDLGMSIGANGVVNSNQLDFYLAMAHAVLNMLATVGGEEAMMGGGE